MEYIRLLHPKNYDHELQRFNDLCFKKLDGGVSVVHRECIEQGGGIVCTHLRVHYNNLPMEPPVCFCFQDRDIPQGGTVHTIPSTTGDLCHREIRDLSDNRLLKFFKRRPAAEFFICDIGGLRQLTPLDIVMFPR
jgi:hypothetical protein